MTNVGIRVSRIVGNEITTVGSITGTRSSGFLFSYDEAYRAARGALPLSLSLPLDGGPFEERSFRPYFEGLLAEGEPRRKLCAEAGISEDDYLSLLVYCGKDCIGDVVVTDGDEQRLHKGLAGARFEPVSDLQMRNIFHDASSIADSNNASRLSLAGTQNKVGLAHSIVGPWNSGWLRPQGFTASTHILKTAELRDLPELEFVCMRAATACGINCAETHLMEPGRPVVVSARFDRVVKEGHNHTILDVWRMHQEDFAQAVGVTPASKYSELPGGSIKAMSDLLRRRSVQPLADLSALARMIMYNYLVGNCDAHLKNFSIWYPNGGTDLRLAPAYDLVSTTYFERFSREMAMQLGKHRTIDEVVPSDFEQLAVDLGLGIRFLRAAAAHIAKTVVPALTEAASSAEAFESTTYIVEDLIDELQPRLAVLDEFAKS